MCQVVNRITCCVEFLFYFVGLSPSCHILFGFPALVCLDLFHLRPVSPCLY